jgi:hypothetical protein
MANTKRLEVTFNRSVENRVKEHDRLVGWKSYNSSLAAFNTKCHPKFELTLKEQNRKQSTFVSVYFKQFTSIVVPTYSFLKIGITRHGGRRFSFDSEKFIIKDLADIRCKERNTALKHEKELLAEFAEFLQPPKIRLLSGGYSECLVYDQNLISTVMEAFKVRGGKSCLPKEIDTSKIDLNIITLLGLIDFRSIKKENSLEYNELELKRIIGTFRNGLKKLEVPASRMPTRPELFEYCYKKLLT